VRAASQLARCAFSRQISMAALATVLKVRPRSSADSWRSFYMSRPCWPLGLQQSLPRHEAHERVPPALKAAPWG
jgi:hypothetical protein